MYSSSTLDCMIGGAAQRVLDRLQKMVDVITTGETATLFKKFTKIANVRRSSWANRRAIRIAYWMGLIKKMMLGYGKYAGPQFPLATLGNLSKPAGAWPLGW